MSQDTTTEPRGESWARWQAALDRAIAANLSYIELMDGDGAWAVGSSQDSERGYLVTSHTCTCAAGRGGDPICKHRALVRALVGLLPLDGVACPSCNGGGAVYFCSGNQEPCAHCGGTGVKPDLRLQGAPSIEVKAAA